MTRPTLRALALLALASTVAACGGAAEDVKAPAVSVEDLATPERAYAALGRAEGELALALGPAAPGGGEPAQQLAAVPLPAPPPPPPPPPPAALQPAEAPPAASPPSRARGDATKEAPAGSTSPCTTACAALTSMERAADHLCTLAGAEDTRCANARDRVKNATARVRAACPACAG